MKRRRGDDAVWSCETDHGRVNLYEKALSGLINKKIRQYNVKGMEIGVRNNDGEIVIYQRVFLPDDGEVPTVFAVIRREISALLELSGLCVGAWHIEVERKRNVFYGR